MLIDESVDQLTRELLEVKLRNAKVEADKAWEVSKFRVTSICAITYVVAATLLFIIGADHFWLGALVPTVGYFLSSRSLPMLKRWWIRERYKR